MPFQGEPSGYRSLRRLAESPRVRTLLGRARVRADGNESGTDRDIRSTSITRSQWLPDLVLAVDGSHVPVSVRNGFPGAMVGYMAIAAVLLDIAKLRDLDSHRPV